MKKLVLPLTVFVAGLLIAHYMFGVDIPEMFEGFGKFIADILKGGGK